MVGIGASAGSLEALQEFFKATPLDTGLAFVVIQHLSPDYKSLMDELLTRHTQLPIKVAKDGMIAEADKIYLIPPRKNMTIFHGKLLLVDQGLRSGLNLPIDIFSDRWLKITVKTPWPWFYRAQAAMGHSAPGL